MAQIYSCSIRYFSLLTVNDWVRQNAGYCNDIWIGCVMMPSGQSLRIFAGILKATIFEKLGATHKLPIKKNWTFSVFLPDYSQFLKITNALVAYCRVSLSVLSKSTATLSQQIYVTRLSGFLFAHHFTIRSHLFLPHQNTVGSTHSLYIAVGIKG